MAAQPPLIRCLSSRVLYKTQFGRRRYPANTMSLTFATKGITVNGRPSRILLQNENGPCALIALSNVLLLSPNYAETTSQLRNLAQAPTVTLRDLVAVLADIAMQLGGDSHRDMDRMLELLPKLQTGLLIDPAFNGTFREGDEMALFRMFQVGLVHTWLMDVSQAPQDYSRLSQCSYEEAQRLLVEAYDIQQGSVASEKADQLLQDAHILRSFLSRSATQMTSYGLQHLKRVLPEGAYAVLFRNDHFATICKQEGELFILVTDLGYQYRHDIVWQSLSYPDGSEDTFYTGDFVPTRLEDDSSLFPDTAAGEDPFADKNATFSAPSLPPDSAFLTDEELARHLQQEEDGLYVRSLQRQQERSHRRPAPDPPARNASRASRTKTKSKNTKRKICIIM